MSPDVERRARSLNEQPVNPAGRAVIYWMQNSQRADANPALDFAVALANEHGVGVVVYVALDATMRHATARAFSFMLDGLRETAAALQQRGVRVIMSCEPPVAGVLRRARDCDACAIVTDLSPLRRGRRLRQEVADTAPLAVIEVDGDHVVPLRLIGREQWAARTIRPVLHRLLPDWLHSPESPRSVHPAPTGGDSDADVNLAATTTADLLARLAVDMTVPPAHDAPPGPAAAEARLSAFLASGLPGYADRRRQTDGAGSGLSPYLRFGQMSPLRVALAARDADVPPDDRAAFLEELIVRRELASNFVYYNAQYDRLDGLPDWASSTLARHADDARPAVYSRDEFAAAETHDPIWNAAQRELLARGRIHNYVRMYWGKKIIEWSSTHAEALATALWLNDRFALDGRSANGFTNVQWCFGKHDRPWAERPVFGTVRWMSEKGMAAKFDLKTYLGRWGAPAEATPCGATQTGLL